MTMRRVRKNRSPRQRLKKKAWSVFSKACRLSLADQYGAVECYTCGKVYHWTKMHAGHYIPAKYGATQFDWDNVRPQCAQCNCFGSGHWSQSGGAGERHIFANNLMKEGIDPDALKQKAHRGEQPTDDELEQIVHDMRSVLAHLDETRTNAPVATHSSSVSPEFKAWINMRARCYRKTEPAYARYGARGIQVCELWKNNFALFLHDVGLRPSPLHSLDRIDNEGNYEPDNVRWATQNQQARNTRWNSVVEHNGEILCIAEWSERTGLAANTIVYRLRRGWSVEQALTLPLRRGKKPTPSCW